MFFTFMMCEAPQTILDLVLYIKNMLLLLIIFFSFQFVDYLQNEALIIEVWGRQKGGAGGGAPLSTRELVTREMSMVDLKTKVLNTFF